MRVIGIIPARFASTRLPGKPLVQITGKPLVQRVYERARQAKRLDRVLVAIDDERIAEAVRNFGGEFVMTSADHASGTDRIAEAAARCHEDLFVNVQGDEPLIEPTAIDQLVAAFDQGSDVDVATLCVPMTRAEDINDPNVVKVVFDEHQNALYFSRAPIPHVRDANSGAQSIHFKHLGLYAYRRDPLLAFARLERRPLEISEQLEQLRFLEYGFRIRVVETQFDSISVDVPADVEKVERMLRDRPETQ